MALSVVSKAQAPKQKGVFSLLFAKTNEVAPPPMDPTAFTIPQPVPVAVPMCELVIPERAPLPKYPLGPRIFSIVVDVLEDMFNYTEPSGTNDFTDWEPRFACGAFEPISHTIQNNNGAWLQQPSASGSPCFVPDVFGISISSSPTDSFAFTFV